MKMNTSNNNNLIIVGIIILIAIVYSTPIFPQQKPYKKYTTIETTELIVTYTLRFQKDSTNPNFINQEDMFLLLGKNVSKFVNADYFVFDTLSRQFGFRELPNKVSDGTIQMPRTLFLFNIIKNYPKGYITRFDHVIGSFFKFEEELNLFNWQLVQETATIAGYKVQKAVTEFGGRKWVAWFSPDIPYNDGPYSFNGLPGLIVKIHDTRNHYVFEMESINKPPHKIVIEYENQDYIPTTKQGFFRAQDSFREDIIDRARAAGIDHEGQQRIARNMAARNNPIELKRK